MCDSFRFMEQGGHVMHRTLTALALALLTAGAACSRNNNATTDTTLNTDLSLAAQQRGVQPDSLNAAELNPSATPATGAATTTHTASTGTVHHSTSSGTTHHRSSSGSSSGRVYSSGGTVTSSPTVVKHTKRDAAIGAAAGAVIGATTSRNKVKGGLIGAAVGGILGGVIGNNVDKTKKP